MLLHQIDCQAVMRVRLYCLAWTEKSDNYRGSQAHAEAILAICLIV